MTAHHCGLNSAGHVAQFDSSRTDAATEPPPGVMSVTAINLLPRGAPIGRNLRRLGYCSQRCRATMPADIACNPQTYSRASGNTIMSVWLCRSQQYSQHALHTVGCGTQSMYGTTHRKATSIHKRPPFQTMPPLSQPCVAYHCQRSPLVSIALDVLNSDHAQPTSPILNAYAA